MTPSARTRRGPSSAGPASRTVIGLTGSIGMGKSTTAQMFRDEGVPVLDADAVVHSLYEGAAVPLIEAAFPGVTANGAIDRAKLRTRVLGDDAAMAHLEGIVHPLVADARRAFLDATIAAAEPLAVLDVPLLFETGLDRECDHVVVVSAPEAVQKARVLARPGMTEAQLSGILARQVPDAEKRRRADTVIETGLGFDHARGQVRDLVRRLRDRT